MKKVIILLGIFIASLMVSCDQRSAPETASGDTTQLVNKFNSGDSAFLSGWNRVDTIHPITKFRFDEPVPRALANECIREYKTVFGGTIPSRMDLTHFVLFNTDELKGWFAGLPTDGESRSIIIEFGIYTENAVRTLNTNRPTDRQIPERHIGRLTVFFSPVSGLSSDGTPIYSQRQINSRATDIDPFNLGSLHP